MLFCLFSWQSPCRRIGRIRSFTAATREAAGAVLTTSVARDSPRRPRDSDKRGFAGMDYPLRASAAGALKADSVLFVDQSRRIHLNAILSALVRKLGRDCSRGQLHCRQRFELGLQGLASRRITPSLRPSSIASGEELADFGIGRSRDRAGLGHISAFR